MDGRHAYSYHPFPAANKIHNKLFLRLWDFCVKHLYHILKLQLEKKISEQKIQSTSELLALALKEYNKVIPSPTKELHGSEDQSNWYAIAALDTCFKTDFNQHICLIQMHLPDFIKIYYFFSVASIYWNRALTFNFSVMHGIGLHLPVYLYGFFFFFFCIQILI